MRCWELGRAWWVVRSGLAGQPAGRLLGKHRFLVFLLVFPIKNSAFWKAGVPFLY